MYRIRSYEGPDRAQTARLLRRLWSQDAALNEEYLGWRYRRNPFPGSCLAVAELGGQIVAVRGAYAMRWRVGDSLQIMPCAGDTVVELGHEGQGLVQRLTRHLFARLRDEGVRYVVNQSPGPAVETISLRTGWRRVGTRCPIRYSVRDRPGEQGFANLDANAASAAKDIVVRSRPPEGIPQLLATRRGPGVRHCFDGAYVRWRFANPLCEYRWLCAYQNELSGYLVMSRSRIAQGSSAVRLLDLWGVDAAVQAELLYCALQWGRFQEFRLWWDRFPGRVSRALADLGFRAAPAESKRRSALLVNNLVSAEDFSVGGVDLLDMRNWGMSMVHADTT